MKADGRELENNGGGGKREEEETVGIFDSPCDELLSVYNERRRRHTVSETLERQSAAGRRGGG